MKIKNSYRKAVINTILHPILQKNQIVEILYEEGDCYIVQCFRTSNIEKIEKKYTIVN
jgi:hypothetical protein